MWAERGCAVLAFVLVSALAVVRTGAVFAASDAAPEGQEAYRDYCAPCHGKSGKGDGRMAAFLKVKPADLTQWSKTHHGKLPAADIHRMIPLNWFRPNAISRGALGPEKMDEIEAYLRSLQEK